MKRLFGSIFIALVTAALLSAQLSQVKVGTWNSAGNLQYICSATEPYALPAPVPITATFVHSNATLTNVVVTGGSAVATAPAHGLWVGSHITVTGSATTALNNSYAVTAVTTNTFTFTTTAGNGTYTDPTITTIDPILSSPVWTIQVLVYDGSNRWVGSYYAGSGLMNLACTNQGNY
jgi:hypothetical protein